MPLLNNRVLRSHITSIALRQTLPRLVDRSLDSHLNPNRTFYIRNQLLP